MKPFLVHILKYQRFLCYASAHARRRLYAFFPKRCLVSLSAVHNKNCLLSRNEVWSSNLSTLLPAVNWSQTSGKIHEETENEYAHSVMEKHQEYIGIYSHPLKRLQSEMRKDKKADRSHQILDKINENLSDTDPKEIARIFYGVSCINSMQPMSIEDKNLDNLIKHVVQALPHLSIDDLILTLQSLCLWPATSSTRTPNFCKLWNAIDKECTIRADQLNVEHLFRIADYWFHLRISRISKYNRKMIEILSKQLQKLSIHQIVQLLFFINLQRKVPSQTMQTIENVLEAHLDDLGFEEAAIICMGYFKTQTSFTNLVIGERMFNLLMNNLEKGGDVLLVAILKQLRSSPSSEREYRLMVKKLFGECSPYITRFPPHVLTHLALLGMSFRIYCPTTCELFALASEKHLGSIRLKDLTKLIACFGYFGHIPDPDVDFFTLIIEELKKPSRKEEIHSYPCCLISSLLNLSFLGIYDEELLAWALSPEFISKYESVFVKEGFVRDIVVLDFGVEIEQPSFTRPRFNRYRFIEKHALRLTGLEGRIPSRESPRLSRHETLLLNILDDVQCVLHQDHVCYLDHVLPHYYSPDILLHSSSVAKPTQIQEFTRPKGEIFYPPYPSACTVITVCGRHQHSFFDMKPLGSHHTKVRQLRLLGYKVIEIHWLYYNKMTTKEKLSFLSQQIKI